jgi:hypothetical protein
MLNKRDFWERVGSSVVAGLVVACVVGIILSNDGDGQTADAADRL